MGERRKGRRGERRGRGGTEEKGERRRRRHDGRGAEESRAVVQERRREFGFGSDVGGREGKGMGKESKSFIIQPLKQ